MVVEFENLKGIKPLNEFKALTEKDIIRKIKLLEKEYNLDDFTFFGRKRINKKVPRKN